MVVYKRCSAEPGNRNQVTINSIKYILMLSNKLRVYKTTLQKEGIGENKETLSSALGQRQEKRSAQQLMKNTLNVGVGDCFCIRFAALQCLPRTMMAARTTSSQQQNRLMRSENSE